MIEMVIDSHTHPQNTLKHVCNRIGESFWMKEQKQARTDRTNGIHRVSLNSLYPSSWWCTARGFVITFRTHGGNLRKTPQIVSTRHVRAHKPETRGLRALRVRRSRLARRWIPPQLSSLGFSPKSEGAWLTVSLLRDSSTVPSAVPFHVWLQQNLTDMSIYLYTFGWGEVDRLQGPGARPRLIKGTNNVTRQARTLRTWAETSLADK